MLNCLIDDKRYFDILNHILDLAPPKWTKNLLWDNNTCCLSYTANTMAADAVLTLEARASALSRHRIDPQSQNTTCF